MKHARLYLHEVVVKWDVGIMRIVATCERCGEAVQIGPNGLPVEDSECAGEGHAVPIAVYEPHAGGPRHPDDVDIVNTLLGGESL